jgi:hypothetical protein
MVAVKGRLQNNTFISEEDIAIPDGVQVIMTVLDGTSFMESTIPHAQLQTKIEKDTYNLVIRKELEAALLEAADPTTKWLSEEEFWDGIA